MSTTPQTVATPSASPDATATSTADTSNGVHDLRDILPQVELVAEDGENLESEWHRLAMCLLIEIVNYRFRHRNDYYVGGNSFIYFNEEQARNRDFRGPDFFFVDGVPRSPMRDYWVVWEEGGRYPDLIIELLSRSTATADLGVKKDTYERVFHTYEYFCYDPETRVLQGWRLGAGNRYGAIEPNERGWLWCETLQAWLGTWEGIFQGWPALWLRFFAADGRLLPIAGEAEQEQAAAEKQRAEAEKQRADTLAAEVAQLRAMLEKKESTKPTP